MTTAAATDQDPWAGGEDARSVDASTLEPLPGVPATTPAALSSSITTTVRAMEDGWATDAVWRARVLSAWAHALRARVDEVVDLLVAQVGKTVAEARAEVAGAADALEYNGGLARYVGGRAGRLPDGSVTHLVREPLGPWLFIVPWNAPVILLLRDLAPALAAGSTAVVKPAPQTTLVTQQVLDIGRSAGLPSEVVELIVGGVRVGESAVAHPAVRGVAFTGSTTVGAEIMRAAAPGMKRLLLELGGKGASVIFDDADHDRAVAESLRSTVMIAGQFCMACSRVLVQRDSYAEVLDRVVSAMEGVRVGDPRDPGTDMGPLISDSQRDRVMSYVRLAQETATVRAGGETVTVPGLPGHFVRPTVVTDVPEGSRLSSEEIFGPVVIVEPFDVEDDALRKANASDFGLASAVWTADVELAWRMASGIRAGTVWVNGYNRNHAEAPTGGYGMSGLGRTRGVEGIEQFTELKHVHFSAGASR